MFKDVLKERRSIRNLKIGDYKESDIVDIVNNAYKYSPTAYAAYDTKCVLLLNEHHNMFWNIVKDVLKAKIGEDRFKTTNEKLNGFQNGIGTILFYRDNDIIDKLKSDNSKYADNFDKWKEHNQGIIQINVWNSLVEYGLSASLQHYNPIIDDKVARKFDIPDNFELIAQMPFGYKNEEPIIKPEFYEQNRIRIIK